MGLCAPARAAWPKPAIEFTNAATADQAHRLVNDWCQAPGHTWSRAKGTGSMRPYIHGGNREFLLLENFTGQPLQVGLVVDFDRGDSPNCLHMVAAINAARTWVYLSGTANRVSDGWFPTTKIHGILRGVVTLPALP